MTLLGVLLGLVVNFDGHLVIRLSCSRDEDAVLELCR